MSEFIGNTIGLRCFNPSAQKTINAWKLLRVDFYAHKDGVLLRAMNAENGASTKKERVISSKEYEGAPYDVYDNTKKAQWALRKLGFQFAHDTEDEGN